MKRGYCRSSKIQNYFTLFCWIHIPYVFIYSFDAFTDNLPCQTVMKKIHEMRSMWCDWRCVSGTCSELQQLFYILLSKSLLFMIPNCDANSIKSVKSDMRSTCLEQVVQPSVLWRKPDAERFKEILFFCSHLQVKKEPLVTWRPCVRVLKLTRAWHGLFTSQRASSVSLMSVMKHHRKSL